MHDPQIAESAALNNVLSRLKGVKHQRNGSVALCPCPDHGDRNPSLSVREKDGKILLKCFAGCSSQDVIAAIGLTMADLSVNRRQSRGGDHTRPIRIDDLSRDKQLPAQFLSDLGLENTTEGVRIGYRMIDGSRAPRARIRTALVAKNGSRWDSGQGPIVPYGLWKLSQARDSKFLVLVEGESDCWTLWHHGLPALGIPGAAMVACMHGEHLANVSNLFIIREPDAGGAAFVLGIAKRLGETHWRGKFGCFARRSKRPKRTSQIESGSV